MDADRVHRQAGRTGVLLVNLGTPDDPSPPAIRRYLRQFLSDRRVVEFPRALWLLVLYAFILPFRPKKLSHAYASVWSNQGSPLMAISRRQHAALQARFEAQSLDVCVELAMTYGQPSISDAMDRMLQQGVRRLLVLPMYPQYSATTTAAVFDAVHAHLKTLRWPPELRLINGYHDDAPHIAALANSVRRHWAQQGRGEHLLMSFHSIPRKYLEAGDPYYCFCRKTARLLADDLELADDQWSISFQSRLGNQPWLQPYTDCVVPQLAAAGINQLDVICPGFSADCLETLEEVAIRYAADFKSAGGQALRYIPALNDHVDHIDALFALLWNHLQGWSLTAEAPAALQARHARAQSAMPSLASETLPGQDKR
ncbi:MAG: ferrochelatase [Panacagrimonas sp.]